MFVTKLISAALLLHVALSIPMEEVLNNEAPNFSGREWVVLVAGSRGYSNYRHQSDVAHAYQLVRQHGIPTERIITMMYDDIAQNNQNPKKGNIINHINGPNVYSGIRIDYRGTQVTATNFLNVLNGNSAALRGIGTGRVLRSGSSDHVFIFYSDHGAPGLVAMPYGGVLRATSFVNTLKNMHSQRKFEKAVVYIEACESGSMFKNLLPSNIRVYGTTAANAVESSYACYYDRSRRTYLGDLYSVKWMEDTEAHNVNSENLQQQFVNVRAQTHGSHVMEFGEMTVSYDKLGMYQGSVQRNANAAVPEERDTSDAVDARDVPVMLEFQNLKNAKSQSEKEEIFAKLHSILEKRINLINKIRSIFDTAVVASNAVATEVSWDAKHVLTNHECYYPIVDQIHDKCYDISENEYVLTYLHKFVTLCENGVPSEIVLRAIDQNCEGDKVTETL